MASVAATGRPTHHPDAPPASAHRVAGKYFVVTGGTQGCGEGVTRLLIDEGAAGVVICGRSEANGNAVATSVNESVASSRVIYVRADLSNPDDCKAVISAAEKVRSLCRSTINVAHCSAKQLQDAALCICRIFRVWTGWSTVRR